MCVYPTQVKNLAGLFSHNIVWDGRSKREHLVLWNNTFGLHTDTSTYNDLAT